MAGKEKVYLTSEQKEAYDEIESIAEGIAGEVLYEYFSRGCIGSGNTMVETIPVDDIVAIAYNLKKIEIKEPFEPGELVAVQWRGNDKEDFYFVESKAPRDSYNIKAAKKGTLDDVAPVYIMRKATEEEKVWIGDLGRDFVGQLVTGDLIVYDDYSFEALERPKKMKEKSETKKGVAGIYPASSYVATYAFGKRGVGY